MTVTLKPELAERVEKQVREGRYPTPDEAVNAAVARLLVEDYESGWDIDELRAEIDIGLAELDAGQTVEFTAEDVIRERHAAFEAKRAGA